MRTITFSLITLLTLGNIHSSSANSLVGWGAGPGTNFPPDLGNATTIAAGGDFSVALIKDSSVRVWGVAGITNAFGGFSNVVAIAAGSQHGLVLKSDSTVAAWGSDSKGQCSGAQGISNVVAIAAGELHSLALLNNGRVACWGKYYDPDSGSYLPLSLATAPNNVMAIAAGANHDLLLLSNRTVVALGYDYRWSQTEVPSDLAGVVAIAAGGNASLAQKSDGTLVAWGDGIPQNNMPSKLLNTVAIVAGYYHNLALLTNGTVKGWGDNYYGQATVPAGLSNVIMVAAGKYHSVALVRTESTPPIIVCPANMQVSADAGQCSKSSLAFEVTATNSAGPVTVVSQPSSGNTFPIGTTVVTNTATDGEGNTSICTFTVTVSDNEAPLILCPTNLVLTADAGQCGRSNVTFVVGAVDNCGSAGVISEPSSGSTFPIGITVVTNTATDGHGNTSVCTFTVTVSDNETPLILCPTNLVLTADAGQCSKSNVTFEVGAVDNCGSASVISEPSSGSTFPIGVTVVTNTATDGQGNTSVCTFTVTVSDNEFPEIICPTNIVLCADAGQHCKTNVTFEVGAADNCGSIVVLSEPPSGSTFPTGLTVVTNTATDAHGNATVRTFTVTVTEQKMPEFTIAEPKRADGVFTVAVPTVSGRSYQLEFKNSLTETNWTAIDATIISGDGATNILMDIAPDVQRFYRVKQW